MKRILALLVCLAMFLLLEQPWPIQRANSLPRPLETTARWGEVTFSQE